MEIGGLDEMINEKDQAQDNVVSFEDQKPKRRPFHYWKVGDREYKLKLTTRTIEQVENKYRKNIQNLVTDDGIPPLSVMLTVIQAAMITWEHSISYQKIQDLYDKWTEDGGSQTGFYAQILMPTLAVSGFFTERQAASMLESVENMDSLT